MTNSAEFTLRAIESELRRVTGMPAIAGGAPMSAEFSLERILEVIRGWSPSSGFVVQEDDSDVDSNVSKLDFSSEFSINNPVAGEIEISKRFIGARVSSSSDQTLGNNSHTELVWDTEIFDISDFWDVANPTRLTAPVDGYYLIGGNCPLDSDSDGDRELHIDLNGNTQLASQKIRATAGGTARLVVQTLYFLSAGHYVELVCWHNSGNDLNTTVSGVDRGFWITRMGA